ncbi:protein tesmin/tso1-like cxc 2 [Phtheirospermum japonicum]|uniref:Protein tesmin/tso1-like cxc 2 n=1 Tax=Phtheirospermum japonicum TaxID=374723 RepID=A0A830BGT8_9LAMI|nr:protein tesmin/tso1-like cxc 2 [Phtheirospermum japonicum]
MGENNIKEVMDTPERSKNNQIANSISKFEDSPVFNFINSLSPIKPVKSLPITQTINPLTFASLQSVFTSPHVSSLKECRFLRRHQLSDPSKPEFSSDDDSMFNKNKVNMDADTKPEDHKENLDPSASNSEMSNMSPSSEECSKLIVEFSKNLEYDRDIPNNPNSNDSSQLVPLRDSDRNEMNQNKQGTSCYWEDLMSNPSDLLMFGSPDDTEPHKKSVDPATSFYTCIKNAIQNTLMVSSGRAGEARELEDIFTQPGEESLYRGMRRRCLVYDMSGARAKHLADNSSSDSGNDSSQPVLPRIGLHLNALASTSNDYNNVVNHDSSASRRLLIGPGSFSNFHPPISSGQELLSTTLTDYSLEREIKNVENGVVQVENEETNPSSPKKKSYCECFAAGVYCVEPCACIDCFNKPIHEDTVLATRKQIESRNPLAFAPKVIRGSDSLSEIGDDFSKTPASARHKRGCNCKKSGCLKKYCECYQPISSSKKRPSFSSISSSNFGPGQEFENSSFYQPPAKFSQLSEAVEEYEMPEFLLEGSPNSGAKLSSSPNGKRVSPPQRRLERSSPGLRSSRKLILRSISSFPSLTHNQ